MIGIGELPPGNCTPASEWPIPTQAIALTSLSMTQTGGPSFSVHGYHVYTAAPSQNAAAIWTFYDVPGLGVRIAAHGTLGLRVVDTLGPSARLVSVIVPVSVPRAWHSVKTDGILLSMPRSWKIVSPALMDCAQWIGSFNNEPELVRIKPNILPAGSCAPSIPTAVDAVHSDVVIVYVLPHNIYAPTRHARPIIILHHSPTAITIYAAAYDPNALDLFVHKTGSTITHVLTLVLGRDGRVAGGVLGSVRAVT